MWDFLEYFTYKNVFVIFFSFYAILWLLEISYKREFKKRTFVAEKKKLDLQFAENKEIETEHN